MAECAPRLTPLQRTAEKIRAKIAKYPDVVVVVLIKNAASERVYYEYKKLFPDHVIHNSVRNPYWEPVWNGNIDDFILFLKPEKK
jgi:hypothetical protein